MKYTIEQLAKFIDHTNLKAYASNVDMEILCNEAKKYGFKMVAINSVQVKLCKELLAGSDVSVGAAIGFPLGQTTIEAKEFETIDAIRNGANEIDYVIDISEVKNNNYVYIKDEMERIVDICRKYKVVSKVIFENCYLEKEEIKQLSMIALEVKPDFIKTSTGFGTSGATFEDVELMKSIVKDEVLVKAAGGVKDAETFFEMIRLGASRIGTSSGIKIIDDIKTMMELDGIKEIEL